MLPPKIRKAPKRSSRWRSQAHLNFVRGHACSVCGATAGIEVAHVRLGSGAGLGQRPHDYLAVSLCRSCHIEQHSIGEETFWRGRDIQSLIDAFCASSPKSREIREARNAE